jgi:hypothetical protein
MGVKDLGFYVRDLVVDSLSKDKLYSDNSFTINKT